MSRSQTSKVQPVRSAYTRATSPGADGTFKDPIRNKAWPKPALVKVETEVAKPGSRSGNPARAEAKDTIAPPLQKTTKFGQCAYNAEHKKRARKRIVCALDNMHRTRENNHPQLFKSTGGPGWTYEIIL